MDLDFTRWQALSSQMKKLTIESDVFYEWIDIWQDMIDHDFMFCLPLPKHYYFIRWYPNKWYLFELSLNRWNRCKIIYKYKCKFKHKYKYQNTNKNNNNNSKRKKKKTQIQCKFRCKDADCDIFLLFFLSNRNAKEQINNFFVSFSFKIMIFNMAVDNIDCNFFNKNKNKSNLMFKR